MLSIIFLGSCIYMYSVAVFYAKFYMYFKDCLCNIVLNVNIITGLLTERAGFLIFMENAGYFRFIAVLFLSEAQIHS